MLSGGYRGHQPPLAPLPPSVTLGLSELGCVWLGESVLLSAYTQQRLPCWRGWWERNAAVFSSLVP